MKKIKILLIIILASIGAIAIYKKFDTKKVIITQTDKHLNEYTLLDEENVYEFSNIDKVMNIVNKSGIIVFCNPASSWCQYYLKIVDDVASSNNITKIYYNDIKEDRNNNTLKYQKLVNKLYDYLDSDDTNDKRINMPYLVFIKDGKIITYDNTFSNINNVISADEYFSNENNLLEFQNKLIKNIELYNESDAS